MAKTAPDAKRRLSAILIIDLDEAREQLNQAETLFHDTGMGWWTERAEELRGRIDRGAEFVWFAPYVSGPPE